MKLPRMILIIIFLLAFGASANGQEPPKAVLFDEYGRIPCDDNLGRLDVWYSELRNYPNSVGLVVIATTREEKYRGVFHELKLKEHAKFRRTDRKLALRYVRAISENEFRVQLWMIPSESTEPEIKNIDQSLSLPSDIRPFVLSVEYKFGGSTCPDINEEPVFADFLKANPNSHGNIVVRASTPAEAKKKAARLLQTFQNRYRVPARRLRMFTAALLKPSNYDEPIVEYWYLP